MFQQQIGITGSGGGGSGSSQSSSDGCPICLCTDGAGLGFREPGQRTWMLPLMELWPWSPAGKDRRAEDEA